MDIGLSVNLNTTSEQIRKYIDLLKNKKQADEAREMGEYFFKQISGLVNDYERKDIKEVLKYLFSYLRFLNKVILENANLYSSHPSVIKTLELMRNFVKDEVDNVMMNNRGVFSSVKDN